MALYKDWAVGKRGEAGGEAGDGRKKGVDTHHMVAAHSMRLARPPIRPRSGPPPQLHDSLFPVFDSVGGAGPPGLGFRIACFPAWCVHVGRILRSPRDSGMRSHVVSWSSSAAATGAHEVSTNAHARRTSCVWIHLNSRPNRGSDAARILQYAMTVQSASCGRRRSYVLAGR
jgi:hypothetical protein